MFDIDPANQPPTPPAPTPPAPPPADGDKKFTQADLDKLAGSVRGEATEKSQKELLKALGFEDLDAAKAAVAAAKAAEDANKTEAQRATEEAARYKAEAEVARGQATQAIKVAEVKGALMAARINPERLDAALRLADLTLLEVKDTTAIGVEKVVEALKAQSPEWFITPGTGGAPDATRGGPGSGSGDFRKASRADVSAEMRKYGVHSRF